MELNEKKHSRTRYFGRRNRARERGGSAGAESEEDARQSGDERPTTWLGQFAKRVPWHPSSLLSLTFEQRARPCQPTTSPRQPTYLSSMHRSPPPPPRPRARSRSPRALHRNTGSIFFPRSCTEHDQPHRCAPPTLVDSARERIYFSSTTTRPRRGQKLIVYSAQLFYSLFYLSLCRALRRVRVNVHGKRGQVIIRGSW